MKNNYIQIYFKMDILLNIVKEKGIYDIIIDYKKWMETHDKKILLLHDIKNNRKNIDILYYKGFFFGDITLFIENYKKKKRTIIQCTKKHWYLEEKLKPCIKCNCVKFGLLTCSACATPLCFGCSILNKGNRIFCSRECYDWCSMLLGL